MDAALTAFDLGVTHFVTDNFSIGGSVGLFEIEGGSDATSIGINGEYQFAAMPISVYGGYSTTDFDGVDAETLSIGVRHNFGGTLFDRDRSGAGLVRNAGFGRLGAIF